MLNRPRLGNEKKKCVQDDAQEHGRGAQGVQFVEASRRGCGRGGKEASRSGALASGAACFGSSLPSGTRGCGIRQARYKQSAAGRTRFEEANPRLRQTASVPISSLITLTPAGAPHSPKPVRWRSSAPSCALFKNSRARRCDMRGKSLPKSKLGCAKLRSNPIDLWGHRG